MKDIKENVLGHHEANSLMQEAFITDIYNLQGN